MELASISQVVPSVVTMQKKKWYLCNASPCSVTKTIEDFVHEEEETIAKQMMKDGDGISAFKITHTQRRSIIRRGTCLSGCCKCKCIVMKAVDGYLGMYLDSNNHLEEHVSTDKKLSLREQKFASKHLFTAPRNIVSMMVNDKIIDNNDLQNKKRLVQYHVWNQRKKIKDSNNVEWNLKLAKEFVEEAKIDVNAFTKETINRCLDDKFYIMRNLYVLDHDMHNNDEWRYIIFTTKSALKVLFEGNLKHLWGDGKVSCYI